MNVPRTIVTRLILFLLSFPLFSQATPSTPASPTPTDGATSVSIQNTSFSWSDCSDTDEYTQNLWKGSDEYPGDLFFSHKEIERNLGRLCAVYTGDLDGDGDQDIVVGDEVDYKIVWYEKINSEPDMCYVSHQIFDHMYDSDICIADMNNDGHLDVVACCYYHSITILWNNGATGPSFSDQTINNSWCSMYYFDICDLDRDGDMDIVGGDEYRILWYRNNGGTSPSFTPIDIVYTGSGIRSIETADINGNNAPDILFTSSSTSKVECLYSNGSSNPSFSRVTLYSGLLSAMSAKSGDLDSDGDIDVAAVSDRDDTYEVIWLESNGANPPTFTKHTISTGINANEDLQIADMDLDGDPDLVCGGEYYLYWYENDGFSDPTFLSHPIESIFYWNLNRVSIRVSDLDNDGDMEIAAVSDSNLFLYESWRNAPTHTLSSDFTGSYKMFSGDLNGDGDVDLIGHGYQTSSFYWFENQGGYSPVTTKHTVSSSVVTIQNMHVSDINGDNHIDLLSCSQGTYKRLDWWENSGTASPTFTIHNITTIIGDVNDVHAADLDGDGDRDLAVASDFRLAWYENSGGPSPSFSYHEIDQLNGPWWDVDVFDVQGDTALDIVACNDKIYCFKNDGSSNPTFSQMACITPTYSSVTRIHAFDIDRDGDGDIAAGNERWYENGGGETPSFTEQYLFDLKYDFNIGDFDGDGDVDLCSQLGGSQNILFLFENDGSSEPLFHVHDYEKSGDVICPLFADIDNDGMKELVSTQTGDNKIISQDIIPYFKTASHIPQNNHVLSYLLEQNRKHFWRMEARNSTESSCGPVWSFTSSSESLPDPPSGPDPAHLENNVDIDVILDWNDASGADSYDLYLWEKTGDKPTTPTVENLLSSEYDPPSDLNCFTEYKWEVVSRNTAGSTPSPEWEFTTKPPLPGQPQNPQPPHLQDHVEPDVTLNWDDADQADSYDIFTWKKSDTKPITPTASNLLSSQYDPPANFDYITEYKWQVVSKNVSGSTPSPEWEFTTKPSDLTLLTYSVPEGVINQDYSKQIEASGGVPPYSFSILSGNLPSGIDLSSGGLLSGKAQETGTFSFQVQIDDSDTPLQTITHSYDLLIKYPSEVRDWKKIFH